MLRKKTLAMELLITLACAFLLSACGDDEDDDGGQGTTLTMQLTFPAPLASQLEPLDAREVAATSDFFDVKAYNETDGIEIPILSLEVTGGPAPSPISVTIVLDDGFIQGDQVFLIIGAGVQEDSSITLQFQKVLRHISIVVGEDNSVGPIEMDPAPDNCIDLDLDRYGMGDCLGPDCHEFDHDKHDDCHGATTTTTTTTTTTQPPTTTTTHATTTTTTHATTTTTAPTTTTTSTTTTTVPTTTTTTTTLPLVTYTNTTKAIFDARCISCHGSPGTQPPNLTTYTIVFNERARIKTALVPGGSMVNFGSTAQERQTIIGWIDAGAPE